jgi:hypothetical protein
MTSQDIPNVERLRLEPGDIAVLSYPQKLTPETVDQMVERMAAFREKHGVDIPLLVLDSGGRLQIINKAELG